MGPLALIDFVGLDTTAQIAEIMFDDYREPRYAAASPAPANGRGGLARPEKRDGGFMIIRSIPRSRSIYTLSETRCSATTGPASTPP